MLDRKARRNSITDFQTDRNQPAYLALCQSGELHARVALAQAELRLCRLCPRCCEVDRWAGETKFCGLGRACRVYTAYPHFGEEDCLRGTRGSGTVFFGSCNLRCVFCQNADISSRVTGDECSSAALAGILLELQAAGCHNINLVSPSHVVAQILEAIELAVLQGFNLPLVYNSGGYDSVTALRLLEGVVDIYMPDFKFWLPTTAKRLSAAEDYPEHARQAVSEMHRQVGSLVFDGDGVAQRGLLVRHLVLPSHVDETAQIMAWLARDISVDTYVNIMAQYRPSHLVLNADGQCRQELMDIGRRPTVAEIQSAYRAAGQSGLWRFDARLDQDVTP